MSDMSPAGLRQTRRSCGPAGGKRWWAWSGSSDTCSPSPTSSTLTTRACDHSARGPRCDPPARDAAHCLTSAALAARVSPGLDGPPARVGPRRATRPLLLTA